LSRERKQGIVAPSGPGRAVGCAEKRIEFRFDQESDDPPVETLAWNGKHAFDYGGMLGMSKRCVPEQRTDGGKSSIAGARTIVPLLLKMVEEGTDVCGLRGHLGTGCGDDIGREAESCCDVETCGGSGNAEA